MKIANELQWQLDSAEKIYPIFIAYKNICFNSL